MKEVVLTESLSRPAGPRRRRGYTGDKDSFSAVQSDPAGGGGIRKTKIASVPSSRAPAGGGEYAETNDWFAQAKGSGL